MRKIGRKEEEKIDGKEGVGREEEESIR